MTLLRLVFSIELSPYYRHNPTEMEAAYYTYPERKFKIDDAEEVTPPSSAPAVNFHALLYMIVAVVNRLKEEIGSRLNHPLGSKTRRCCSRGEDRLAGVETCGGQGAWGEVVSRKPYNSCGLYDTLYQGSFSAQALVKRISRTEL
ncbi:hypothetical protein BCON_0003g00090 [Botryotinia convoluta]|uniref:Uncharacterized protein n=1 Tax=Botryotinia convoluta TaxID=54673 RepID=A0A4Z1IX53_9HELO|nr:hypothetical protein BCON_0003g00090 [Botryotinia convoluta]